MLVHLYEDEGPEFLTAPQRHVRPGHVGLPRGSSCCWPAIGWARSRWSIVDEPGRLLFASELKSLLEVPGVPREIDPQALDEYLTYQYVPHPQTIFRGMAKLPPGHYAVYREGRLEVRPLLAARLQRRRRPARRRNTPRELRRLLTSAVGTAAAKRRAAGGVSLRRRRFDDRRRADAATGRRAGADVLHRLSRAGVSTKRATPGRRPSGSSTIHEEFRVEPDAMEILPKLVWHFDEPFADSSAMPTWYVSQLTRQHVTVALTGDGGDELFAGYPRYQAVWLAERFDRLPASAAAVGGGPLLAAAAGQAAAKVDPSAGAKRFVEMLAPVARAPLSRMDRRSSTKPGAGALYSDDFLATLARRGPARSFSPPPSPRSGRRDPVTAASLADLVTYLPVRPDDQGRHRLDGPRPGMPAAVSRLSGGGIGRADAADG